MAFEMGYDQAKRLSQLVREYFPEAKIQVHKDMSGKDRMLSAWIKDPKSNTDSEPYSESE